MSESPVQTTPGPDSDHLVLYDGVCGLCDRLVQFLLGHDRRVVFAFASLQGAVGRSMVERFGGNPDEFTSFYVVANYRSNHAQMLSRTNAALFVAGELGWPWKAAVLLRIFPQTILNRIYDGVARNRYRVFGRYERCLIPRPEFHGRFVE